MAVAEIERRKGIRGFAIIDGKIVRDPHFSCDEDGMTVNGEKIGYFRSNENSPSPKDYSDLPPDLVGVVKRVDEMVKGLEEGGAQPAEIAERVRSFIEKERPDLVDRVDVGEPYGDVLFGLGKGKAGRVLYFNREGRRGEEDYPCVSWSELAMGMSKVVESGGVIIFDGGNYLRVIPADRKAPEIIEKILLSAVALSEKEEQLEEFGIRKEIAAKIIAAHFGHELDNK